MAKRLIDTVKVIEEELIGKKEEKRTPVEQIISKDGMKDKQISAKINTKMYNEFTSINKVQGLSNNSALNMLISKYVRENRSLLDE